MANNLIESKSASNNFFLTSFIYKRCQQILPNLLICVKCIICINTYMFLLFAFSFFLSSILPFSLNICCPVSQFREKYAGSVLAGLTWLTLFQSVTRIFFLSSVSVLGSGVEILPGSPDQICFYEFMSSRQPDCPPAGSLLAGLLSSLAGVLLTLSSPKQTEVTSPEWDAEPGEAPASAVLDWPGS